MTLDPELLEILVCPNDRGELDYREDRAGARLHDLRLPLPDPRRHPGDADRRGREARSQEAARSRRRRPVTRPGRRQALRAPTPATCWARSRRCPSTSDGLRLGDGDATALPLADGVTAVVFCGMGGSAVAGDVLRAVFRDRLGVPVEVNRSPVLPACVRPAHARDLFVVLGGHRGDAVVRSRRRASAGAGSSRSPSGGELAERAAAGAASRRCASRRATCRARRSGYLAFALARRAGGGRAAAAARRRRGRGGRASSSGSSRRSDPTSRASATPRRRWRCEHRRPPAR